LPASTNLETGEITFFLGYEELSSCACAFQGWGRHDDAYAAARRGRHQNEQKG